MITLLLILACTHLVCALFTRRRAMCVLHLAAVLFCGAVGLKASSDIRAYCAAPDAPKVCVD